MPRHIHTIITEKLYWVIDSIRGRYGVSSGALLEFVFWACWEDSGCRRRVLDWLAGRGVRTGSTGGAGDTGSGSAGSAGGVDSTGNAGGGGASSFAEWLVRGWGDPLNQLLFELGGD